jgi:hypothetical protein
MLTWFLSTICCCCGCFSSGEFSVVVGGLWLSYKVLTIVESDPSILDGFSVIVVLKLHINEIGSKSLLSKKIK